MTTGWHHIFPEWRSFYSAVSCLHTHSSQLFFPTVGLFKASWYTIFVLLIKTSRRQNRYFGWCIFFQHGLTLNVYKWPRKVHNRISSQRPALCLIEAKTLFCSFFKVRLSAKRLCGGVFRLTFASSFISDLYIFKDMFNSPAELLVLLSSGLFHQFIWAVALMDLELHCVTRARHKAEANKTSKNVVSWARLDKCRLANRHNPQESKISLYVRSMSSRNGRQQ